jgi:hypothetical protein
MWGLFAIDSGPRQTLQALTVDSSFKWINPCFDRSFLQDDFLFSDINGIVVGTSRSELGLSLESQCRIIAKKLGLPLVAIEDYPGNYQEVPFGQVDLMIVESNLAELAVVQKFGFNSPKISVGASLRFDHLRNNNKSYQLTLPKRGDGLLWLGQPETQDALTSLSRLLPQVEKLGMRFLFRAHPRDVGYKLGSYAQFFSKYSEIVHDVSDIETSALLTLNPCLTLTHFSSMAIELAFYGIPSVHLLFPDAGGATLSEINGYRVPHICSAGGSIAIFSEQDLMSLLPAIIFDLPTRDSVMRCFDNYFETKKPQLEKVIKRMNLLLN